MKCSKCNKRAIIEIRYAGKALCEEHFKRYFENRFRKNIHGKFDHNEMIGVAISGGKDSLTTLYLIKKFVKRADVVAILIDEGLKGYRDALIEDAKTLCSRLDVPLYIFRFKEEYGITIDEIAKKRRRRGICSYCGVLRRNLLNKKARELGCKKLVMGHNLDDEAQVALMNFIRGEYWRMVRMGEEQGLIEHEKFIPRVKPLRTIPEREVVVYAMLRGIKSNFVECRYVHEAYRAEIRDMLNELEAKFPGTKHSILRSNDRLVEILKETFVVEEMPNTCKVCGEPCAGEICKACEMVEEISSLRERKT